MRFITIALLALYSTLTLAAQQSSENTPSSHKVQQIFLQMTAQQKRDAFISTITSTGNICKQVTQMVFDKIKDNKAYWYVACNKRHYEVYIRDDETGTTHVTSCTALNLIGRVCPLQELE
ncbi:hypothetical protein MHM98_06190 [Psychrobium sp. MM17-31]|uniref:hypothetical protein n=1 Tax=Psychrobium sp. MM17-31 TaxID=2917758 RepID=UPI001EF41B1B|nr:hypothetical protein [Psychrobium sp. MM17-31]MCG7530940.1 hypothetical protein [Psychrobium sp. MM17-31]